MIEKMPDKDSPQAVEAHPLKLKRRPEFESGNDKLRVVDLFCGCGGLTLGIAQAAHEAGYAIDVVLAVEMDAAIMRVYEANFKPTKTCTDGVEELFDGELGADLTVAETALRSHAGRVDILVGGPPCQGHSDLNNHTRRDDPKNELYLRMVRAAEVLRPRVILIENVPTVVHAKGDVVGRARERLEAIGYSVAHRVIPLKVLGVAQRRKRHVLLALSDQMHSGPETVLTALTEGPETNHDLRWAIEDLASLENPTGIDVAPKASDDNLKRMKWLLENNEYDLPNDRRPKCHHDPGHSYRSMYGRLKWDEPAQTLTSGFGSIGQGRYMHPELLRALTPHEAARIQGFPDYFDFGQQTPRALLAIMIGNAVPPACSRAIVGSLLAGQILVLGQPVVGSDLEPGRTATTEGAA